MPLPPLNYVVLMMKTTRVSCRRISQLTATGCSHQMPKPEAVDQQQLTRSSNPSLPQASSFSTWALWSILAAAMGSMINPVWMVESWPRQSYICFLHLLDRPTVIMGRKTKKTKSLLVRSVFGWKWIGVSKSVCGGGENNQFVFVFFVFVFDIGIGFASSVSLH